MQTKNLFVFLMAVALALPIATAYNCTKLEGENRNVCNYIESQSWSQSEKDSVIQNLIDNGGSLNGNFESIVGKPVAVIELNKIEEVDQISDENKKFLIDFSSFSLFGYVVYAFLRKYYLLLNL
ncbi:MAG: hypothetical protein WC548_01225 [Candidatus Pacearchaeota archaeon]